MAGEPNFDGQPSRHAQPTIDREEAGAMTMSTGNDPAATSQGGQAPSLAERILTIPVRHEDITRPADLLEAVRHDLAEVLAADVRVRWLEPSDQEAGGTQEAPSPHHGEWELRKRGVVVARLAVDRSEPLVDEERRLVGFLVRDLSHWITEASKRAESRLVTALSTTLPTCESLDEMARVAVFTIVDRLGAEAGMLLIRGDAGFRRLAALGTWPDDETSERERCDLAADCARSYGPKVHPGNVVAAPVGSIMPARYVLLIRLPLPDPRQATGFPALMQAARVLEPHLSARWRTVVLDELLKLDHASTDTPTRDLYQAAVRAAAGLVPGADGGSLLVRHDDRARFVFQAVHGHVPEAVVDRSLSEADLIAWYGSDGDGWRTGSAKVLQHGDIDIARLGEAGDRAHGADGDAANARANASLCLPVVFGDAVLAVLHLENCTEGNAFGRDSREIAEMFGPPLAGLLQRQRTRDLLVRAALTDSLTGLSNRRAFDDALARELARTGRSGAGVSVLLMDMADFKHINDSFGHEAGDAALIAVADALRASVRDGDYLFRWGGDEFAAVLVDEADHLTRATVERLRDAVAKVEVHGRPLRIDVGWAEAPTDGHDAPTLLKVADARMYASKRGADT
jgi:diguanylate cyclase (GGDEF)-like protein